LNVKILSELNVSPSSRKRASSESPSLIERHLGYQCHMADEAIEELRTVVEALSANLQALAYRVSALERGEPPPAVPTIFHAAPPPPPKSDSITESGGGACRS
jgi:hypothetical protein